MEGSPDFFSVAVRCFLSGYMAQENGLPHMNSQYAHQLQLVVRMQNAA